MRFGTITKQKYLYFSSWSKKGYSIFISLGREVRISRLSLHMYGSVLLKSSAKGLIVSTAEISDYVELPLETESGKRVIRNAEGEICPDNNKIQDLSERIYCLQAVYPLFIERKYD